MEVGIELLALDAGVEALEPVLGQRLHQDGLGHLEAVVEVQQILVDAFITLFRLGIEYRRGHGLQGAVEVVDGLDQVLGEALDGKVFGRLYIPLRPILQIAEVGDGSKVLVLWLEGNLSVTWVIPRGRQADKNERGAPSRL